MDVEFDPAKAAENYRKHGIRFADAEQVLRDPFGLTIEDVQAWDEPRFVTLGRDSLGRLLVVVHTPRTESIRIISARKATAREARQYHHA